MRKQGDVGLRDDLPFDDPWENLIFFILERAGLDAVGKALDLNSDERSRNQRIPVINQAREYIHEADSKDPLSFETMCYGINVEPDVLRRQISKYLIQEATKETTIKKMTLGKRKAHYQRIQEIIQMDLQGV